MLCTVLTARARVQQMPRKVKYKDGPAFIYRIYLSDKQGTPFSTEHPMRFLSRRSVERRRRQQLAVDSTDLPVCPRYVRQIERQGLTVVGTSRWRNTVLVHVRDTMQLEPLRRLAFVSRWRQVWAAPDSVTPTAMKAKVHDHFEAWDSIAGQRYGRADRQITTLAGHRLHDIGLQGEGMMIAVLDGGFKNADRIPVLRRADIRGARDFVHPASPSIYYETDHGTKVLAVMAANQPYYYVGTAPKASYWLLRCEDLQTEQEVEEDYWTMAAEFADSVGCDLINSSLGYNEYDHPWMSHRIWELDGRTAFISASASMLARKGIVLVCSAGNTGMGQWKKLTVPADADHILTVGALTEELKVAPFSAVGPTQDLRTKPDVAAIGSPTTVITGRGTISQDMGTSFASPVVCGLTACLWQALRHKSATELMELIRHTSNNAQHPDNIYGYGAPNFWRAYMIGRMGNEGNERVRP